MTSPSAFPELRDAAWLEARLTEGLSTTQIAAMLGCAQSAVSKAVTRQGLASKRSLPVPESLSDHDRLRERFFGGTPASVIATEDDVSVAAVRRALRAAGIIPVRTHARGDSPAQIADREYLIHEYTVNLRSVAEIAAYLRTSEFIVRTAFASHRIPREPRSARPSEATLDRVRVLVSAGRPLADIATELHVRRHTIAGWCADIGVTPPDRRRQFPELHDEMWMRSACTEEGATVRAIADRLGCSGVTVRRALRFFGLGPLARVRSGSARLRYPELYDEDWMRAAASAEGETGTKVAIARNLGCSRRSVDAAFERFGLRTRGGVRRFPELHDKAWVESAWAAPGVTASSIARDLGCSTRSVRDAFCRFGLRTRRRGHQFPELHDRAWVETAWSQEGSSARSIADQLGCNPSTVYDALHRFKFLPGRHG